MTHALVAEPYSSVQVRMGALQAVLYSRSRTPCHCVMVRARLVDYIRLPAALSDELGGLSTSLELFASPPLILPTESVVAMESKGMSRHGDCNLGGLSPRMLHNWRAPAPRHSLPRRPFGQTTVGRLVESLSGMLKQPTAWPIHVVHIQS